MRSANHEHRHISIVMEIYRNWIDNISSRKLVWVSQQKLLPDNHSPANPSLKESAQPLENRPHNIALLPTSFTYLLVAVWGGETPHAGMKLRPLTLIDSPEGRI